MDEPFCPKCSAAARPGAKFCSRCGTPLLAQPPSSRQDSRDESPYAGDAKKEQESEAGSSPLSGILRGGRMRLGWGQRIWDIITMSGCTGVAGLWYWYSGMADTAPDYKTCAAVVLLPLALIVFRRQIDRMLLPIQGIRNKIPPLIRLGIGLAIPFLVSNYLYARGFSQFDFMFKTVVVSTLTSFIILRNPIIPNRAVAQGGSP